MIRTLTAAALLTLAACAYNVAWAQVGIANAWVRASVPGQQATGAFMQITARQPARLVGASSPVAASAEVHEMKMEGDVMRMRALPLLDLPAGQAVALEPGGHHIMLIGLKRPLAVGETVPLTLTVQDADGQTRAIEVAAPVRALNAAAPMQHSKHEHGAHEH
jgi:copper(I)-binding protein